MSLTNTDPVKVALLGVPEAVLRSHGAVSAETAQAMAEGARRRLKADVAIAITGIAGPGADGTEKPVGLTFVWFAGPHASLGRRFVFEGDRWGIRRAAAEAALRLLLEQVLERQTVGHDPA